MISLCPDRYLFPVFGRCSRAISLEKAVDVGEGMTTRVLDQDDVYRNLGGEPNSPSRESYPRKLYVTTLRDGYATHQGGYITQRSHLVEELSQYYDRPIAEHRYLHSLRLFRRIKKIDRPVVGLAGAGQYNYCHWWLDVLPKIHLLRSYAGLPPDPVYYVETSKSFQKETLGYLGLGPSSLLNSREYRIIRARTLIAASPRSPLQKPDIWAVAWLRQTFLPFAEPHPEKPLCVLISRQGAKVRQIVNEDEIASALAPLNPVRVVLEKLSVAQQMGLFAGARWIIAPHGAGLTNTLFASRDCRIIELFGSVKHNDCYGQLAQAVGCRYDQVLGTDAIDPKNGEKHIRADIAALKATVFG